MWPPPFHLILSQLLYASLFCNFSLVALFLFFVEGFQAFAIAFSLFTSNSSAHVKSLFFN